MGVLALLGSCECIDWSLSAILIGHCQHTWLAGWSGWKTVGCRRQGVVCNTPNIKSLVCFGCGYCQLSWLSWSGSGCRKKYCALAVLDMLLSILCLWTIEKGNCEQAGCWVRSGSPRKDYVLAALVRGCCCRVTACDRVLTVVVCGDELCPAPLLRATMQWRLSCSIKVY